MFTDSVLFLIPYSRPYFPAGQLDADVFFIPGGGEIKNSEDPPGIIRGCRLGYFSRLTSYYGLGAVTTYSMNRFSIIPEVGVLLINVTF